VEAVHFCGLDNTFEGECEEDAIRAAFQRNSPPLGCSWENPWNLRVGYSLEDLPKRETFDIILVDGKLSSKLFLNNNPDNFFSIESLLRPGGYMVFDEFLDFDRSPEVEDTVENIASFTKLRKVGVSKNTKWASGHSKHSGRYVFKKQGPYALSPVRLDPEMQPTLCIVTCTHERENGSTPRHLQRMWQNIQRQSYRNWKLFLTGDGYVNMTEWNGINFISDPRVDMVNMAEPGERGKLPEEVLWQNAGTKAVNMGIDRAVAAGHEWIVRLDDDDLWDEDHLQNIVRGIHSNASFVMTSAQYLLDFLPWPRATTQLDISHVPPYPCQVIQSSVAFNAKVLTSRYTISEMPGDASMWARIFFYTQFHPTYVPVDSVHHISERGSHPNTYVGRKWAMNGSDIPPGWIAKYDRKYEAMEYTAIVIDRFPSQLSSYCTHVIGPTEDSDSFSLVNEEEIPYYIRVVPELEGMLVWTPS